MAKQTTPKAPGKLGENETLNGSNTLPALIEISDTHSITLGEVVAAAHDQSGLSVEAWNTLSEAERDELLNKTIEDFRGAVMPAGVPSELVTDLKSAAAGVAEGTRAALDEHRMMIAEQVLIISAPGGPRRRAGFSFGPVPVELTFDELGPDPKAVLEQLRADPLLKIDGRMVEREAKPEDME